MTWKKITSQQCWGRTRRPGPPRRRESPRAPPHPRSSCRCLWGPRRRSTGSSWGHTCGGRQEQSSKVGLCLYILWHIHILSPKHDKQLKHMKIWFIFKIHFYLNKWYIFSFEKLSRMLQIKLKLHVSSTWFLVSPHLMCCTLHGLSVKYF